VEWSRPNGSRSIGTLRRMSVRRNPVSIPSHAWDVSRCDTIRPVELWTGKTFSEAMQKAELHGLFFLHDAVLAMASSGRQKQSFSRWTRHPCPVLRKAITIKTET
jgi:hypothetical protein